MVSISLGAHEVQYCALLAERRNVVKGVYGVRNQRHHQRSDFETHLIGIMGEYATAKHFGVTVDTSVALAGDDKISDLRIGNYRVQVKTRAEQRGGFHMYFNSLSLFKADRAISTCIAGPASVQIVGWMDRASFAELATELDFGYGKRIGVPHKSLFSIGDWDGNVEKL
jgi:hypothetical protein